MKKEFIVPRPISEIYPCIEESYSIKRHAEKKLILYTRVSKDRQFLYGTIVHEIRFHETQDGCRLVCRTRPTYPALLILAVLLCAAVYSFVMLLLGEAAPLFCIGVAFLFLAGAASAFWQAGVCSGRLSERISALATEPSGDSENGMRRKPTTP